MPTSRWKSFAEPDPDREYLALVSCLPLSRLSHTPKMLRLAREVRGQLAGASGLVGFSMKAKPLAKRYWTLSTWDDDAALQAFVMEIPHVEVMSQLSRHMGATKFVRWQVPGSRARLRWDDGLRRLG